MAAPDSRETVAGRPAVAHSARLQWAGHDNSVHVHRRGRVHLWSCESKARGGVRFVLVASSRVWQLNGGQQRRPTLRGRGYLQSQQGLCARRHRRVGLRSTKELVQPSPELVAVLQLGCWRQRRPVACRQRIRGGWSCRMAGMGPFARVLVGSVPKTAFFMYFRVYGALCRRPLCVVSMVTISKACLPTIMSSWARVVSVIGRC